MSDELTAVLEPVADSTAVDSTAAVETPNTESTTPEESTPDVKTGDAKSSPKEVSDSPTANAEAPLSKINEQLKSLRETDPSLAKAIHSKVSDGLRLAQLLKSNDVKDVAGLQEKIANGADSKFRTQVEETDALLYDGGAKHKELATNIYNDLEATVGELASERMGSLAENLLGILKEKSPELHNAYVRSTFIDTCESAGLVSALNTLSTKLHAGDARGAATVLREIVDFFNSETAENTKYGQARATAAAENERITTEAHKAVSSACQTPFANWMLGAGKAVAQDSAKLNEVASAIRTELTRQIGKPGKNMAEYRAKVAKAAPLVVAQVTSRFSPKQIAKVTPRVQAASPTVSTKLNGQAVKAFVFKARPANLLREDVTYQGREYSRANCEMLQLSKQQGFVKGTSGKPVLVTWKRA